MTIDWKICGFNEIFLINLREKHSAFPQFPRKINFYWKILRLKQWKQNFSSSESVYGKRIFFWSREWEKGCEEYEKSLFFIPCVFLLFISSVCKFSILYCWGKIFMEIKLKSCKKGICRGKIYFQATFQYLSVLFEMQLFCK